LDVLREVKFSVISACAGVLVRLVGAGKRR
jgi:hypothetical protein